MKKIIVVLMVMSVWLAPQAQAKVFSDSGCRIDADNNGLVTISCPNSADLAKYNWAVEFCPDVMVNSKDKSGSVCGNNLRIDVQSGTVQLDMGAVADGQRSFNFKHDVGTWSQVLGFKAGKNIVVERSYDPHGDGSDDGKGGCHYTFVGDLPAGSYVPLDPQTCGAGSYAKARRGGGKATVTRGGGESSVSVSENEQGAVATANGHQSSAAAHNSAAGYSANNSSEAVNNNFLNMNVVKSGKKGKKGSHGDTFIQYAPNAHQSNETTIIKGATFDIKNYNLNKNGKASKTKKGQKHIPSGGATAVNGDIINYNPMYITIHQGVKGAQNYNPYACSQCHSDSAKKDAEMRELINKKLHHYSSVNKR